MPTYFYKAITENGQIVKNKIIADSKVDCIENLKKNGLTPIKIVNFDDKNLHRIYNKNNKFSINREIILTGVSKRDVRTFTQSLYLLKKSKFNNIYALNTLFEATNNKKMQKIIGEMLNNVKSGRCMYETMEKYPKIFSFVYVNIIRAGEISGTLEKSLEQAVNYLDKSEELNNKLKRILLPNIIIFFGILIMLIVCTICVIPAIQNLFDSIGSKDELPKITLWFYGVIKFIYQNAKTILIAIITIFILLKLYFKSNYGKRKLDYLKYSIPIFGKFNYMVDFSRVIRCFLVNIENGSKIQNALEVCKNVTKNSVMNEQIRIAIKNAYCGKSWIEPFENSKFANKISIEMLKVGMKTNLKEMCSKLLDYVDSDIDNYLDRMTKILPEVSYAIVGVILIFFVLVILVPCIEVYMGGFIFSAYDL